MVQRATTPLVVETSRTGEHRRWFAALAFLALLAIGCIAYNQTQLQGVYYSKEALDSNTRNAAIETMLVHSEGDSQGLNTSPTYKDDGVELSQTGKAFISDLLGLFSARKDGAEKNSCTEMPGCGTSAKEADEYGACLGDGSYAKLATDVANVAAYDHVLYVAKESKNDHGVVTYDLARKALAQPDCQTVLSDLKKSTPTFTFRSVADVR